MALKWEGQLYPKLFWCYCVHRRDNHTLNMGTAEPQASSLCPCTVSSSGAAAPWSLLEELWLETPGSVPRPHLGNVSFTSHLCPMWSLLIPLSWSHRARSTPNRVSHSNCNAGNCSSCAYLQGKKYGRMRVGGWCSYSYSSLCMGFQCERI